MSLNRNHFLSFRGDHVMHLIVFSPIPLLLFLLFSKHPRVSIIKVAFLSLILAILFEFSHAIVPYRSFTIDDLLANIAGVFIGILVLAIFRIIYKD
jgi:VanZ family protein